MAHGQGVPLRSWSTSCIHSVFSSGLVESLWNWMPIAHCPAATNRSLALYVPTAAAFVETVPRAGALERVGEDAPLAGLDRLSPSSRSRTVTVYLTSSRAYGGMGSEVMLNR